MAWLAHLDTRARRWPRPAHWLYLAARWYLIAAGIILVLVTAREGSPLAIGIVSAAAAGVGSGILQAVDAHRRSMRGR